MFKPQPRMQRERKTIEILHQIYCHNHHASRAGELCPECRTSCDYAVQRLERCPFQEDKSTCANCAVHCYKPEMRVRIRAIMRYAGPRMLLYHPILSIRHLIDGRRKPPRLPQHNATTLKN